MNISFRARITLSFITLIMTAVFLSSWYFYSETRDIIVGQMAERIEDIAKTGTFLFDDRDRRELANLIEAVINDPSRKLLSDRDVLKLSPGDSYPSLPEGVSREYMNSPEFLNIIQKLRQIKIASREKLRRLRKIRQLDMMSVKSDQPIINYVYILAALPEFKRLSVMVFIGDSDYEKIDNEGGNPLGSIYAVSQNSFKYAMYGYPRSEREFISDQWGTWLSGAAPILDRKGKVIAILGLDYDVTSEANKLRQFQAVFWTILIVTLLFSLPVPIFISASLAKPILVLTEASEKIRNRNFNVRLPIKNKDEIGKLAGAFNAMAEAIGDYSKRMEVLNKAYFRFVPQNFLNYLGVEDISEINLGDQVQREMTVFFSDIRAFTTISEKMNPKENFTFINEYLSMVGPVIRQYNGFIDKYIGDAIMALFPLSVDDAINAAIHIRTTLKEYNLKQKQKGIEAIDIGIGVNSGKLMLGTIGEEERMETTVISDTVNLAARLEAETKRLSAPIIVSEYVYEKIQNKNLFHMRYVGMATVKGKSVATHLFQVLMPDDTSLPLYDKTKKEFETAVKTYFKGEVEVAKKMFETILAKNPMDSVAAVYNELSSGKRRRKEDVSTAAEKSGY